MSETESPRRGALGTIFLTLFLDLAGFSIIFPLSPSLLEHYLKQEGREGLLGGLIRLIESASPLASSDPVYAAALFGGVLGSIYSLLQFLSAPLWGSLSDRTGRKPILILSVSGTALSYLLWAFSGSFSMFIASRFLAGTMSGNLSVATAAAADISSEETRAKAMGMVGAAFGLGFILGPALGALLSRWDLQARYPSLARLGINPFSACALGAFSLSLLNLYWLGRRFRETLPPGSRTSAETQREKRRLHPLLFLRPLGLPGVRTANVIYFIYILAFGAMEFTLTFLARERFHYEPHDNMYLFLFVGILMALVQGGLVRRLAPRLGERRLARLGLVLVIPGFAIMARAETPPVLYLGLFFMGLGSGLFTPSVTALVSLYTPRHRQGEVLGIFRSAGSFARVLGPLAGTFVFWRFGSLWTYLLGAVLMAPALFLALTLPPPDSRPAAR